jgi:predicted AAA+ superfamily ATPase
MIDRQLEDRIESALRAFPVVGIMGARQVGKTTLAKSIANNRGQAVYIDLELPSDLAKLDEPELYLRQHADSLVILDEVQRKPELFPILRALVDDDRRNGRFLILGSASPGLARQSAESRAGRIEYHELAPLSLDEVSLLEDGHSHIWYRGGYPLSYLSESDDLSFRWRQAFIQTDLERDLPNLGVRVPASALHRFFGRCLLMFMVRRGTRPFLSELGRFTSHRSALSGHSSGYVHGAPAPSLSPESQKTCCTRSSVFQAPTSSSDIHRAVHLGSDS